MGSSSEAKYGLAGLNLLHEYPSKNGSIIWYAISQIWPEVVSGLRWSIVSGTSVVFWKDIWLQGHPRLLDLAISEVP